jgi:hypothetical protein
MTAPDEVLERRDGDVLHVSVNRPAKHNALSRSVLARLERIFTAVAQDTRARCVVLAGAGTRHRPRRTCGTRVGSVDDGALRTLPRLAGAAMGLVDLVAADDGLECLPADRRSGARRPGEGRALSVGKRQHGTNECGRQNSRDRPTLVPRSQTSEGTKPGPPL